jgi:hypothetical protein
MIARGFSPTTFEDYPYEGKRFRLEIKKKERCFATYV